MVEIPLRADFPCYEFQPELDGVTYTLRVRWNSRESAWYMNISTEDGQIIAAGVKLMLGLPLGSRVRPIDARMPQGLFFLLDTSGQTAEADEADLGGRVKLFYLLEDELPLEAA
jgi:hypothetical protein